MPDNYTFTKQYRDKPTVYVFVVTSGDYVGQRMVYAPSIEQARQAVLQDYRDKNSGSECKITKESQGEYSGP